jgi:hemerythrin-like domain-containing protein
MSASPTALLREQHRLILRVVDAFERATADPALLPPADEIDGFVTFFRLFTDACHHGKEEDVLFAALEEHGLGGGPVDALREEHRYGRTLVRTMAAAVPAMRDGEQSGRAAFLPAAVDYIDFIRGHIAREDDGVFEMVDHQLDSGTCARLCDDYETVCARRFDGLSLADLERTAADLIDRHPPTGSGSAGRLRPVE